VFEYETTDVEVFIGWGDGVIRADDFARQCIAEWNQFLLGEGLLSP
jgi:hypothetical protein